MIVEGGRVRPFSLPFTYTPKSLLRFIENFPVTQFQFVSPINIQPYHSINAILLTHSHVLQRMDTNCRETAFTFLLFMLFLIKLHQKCSRIFFTHDFTFKDLLKKSCMQFFYVFNITVKNILT